MPSLYGFTGNANVSVTNTTGLYQLSSNTGIVQNAYGNLNVAAYLPTYTGNVSSAGLGLSGIFTDHYYYANGAPFIGGSGGAGTYSNANVAAYLTTSTGNIQAGNITVLGNLYVQGNTITRYTANTIASQIIANGAIPSTSTTTGALQSYGGLGVQGNINAGAVYTNNYFYANGTPFASSSYGNSNVSAYMAGGTLGNITVTGNVKAYGAIVSTNFTYPNGVSILSGVTANYGNANVTALLAGTVTIGNLTTVNGVFWPNGEPYSSGSVINTYGNANVAAYLSSNTDPTISNLNANTQQQQAQINTINANVTAANVNIQTISANLGAFETATNLSLAGANAAIATTNANIGSFYTYANATYSTQANAGSLQNQINGANAAIITANTAMKNYVDAGNTTMTNYVNNQVTTANTAMKNYVDAANTIQSNQITTLSNGQTGANASISALQANVGSFYTYANATYSTQANAGALQNQITGANVNIQTISANLGSFETYANATYSTQANAASLQSQINGANAAIVTANTAMKSYVDAANSIQSAQITTLQGQVYSNANAASYLTVYTGNIQAGNVSILTDLSVGGNTIITGNLTVYGNTTTINSNVVTTNDLNITVGNNQTSGAALNNAGIDVGSNNLATWRFNNASTSWQSNINITPQSNAVYNLGAPTLQWNTVYGRDVQAATATYTGNVTAGNVSATNLTNQYNFLQGEIDGANAAIITANTAMKSYVDAANTVMTNYVNNQVTTANTAMKAYVDAGNTVMTNYVNNQVTTANTAMKAYVDAGNTIQSNQINTINANIGSFYTYANATYSTIANAASQQSQIDTINANVAAANAAIITANTAMKAYVDAGNTVMTNYVNNQVTTANTAMKAYVDAGNTVMTNYVNNQVTTANTAMKSYVDAANTIQSNQIQTISANLGAYEIYANAAITSINGNVTAANAAIQTLSANVGAFETVTNIWLGNLQANVYSNANAASYLPTYTGVVGNVIYTTVTEVYTGNTNWIPPINIVSSNVAVLLVAGGGGGGGTLQDSGASVSGGGGGGGGYILVNPLTVIPGKQYSLTIGSGGAGGVSGFLGTAANGTAGGNTTAFGYTAIGGGAGSRGGGSLTGSGSWTMPTGGSGGGGGAGGFPYGNAGLPGAGTSGQGFGGGQGNSTGNNGGGGGGATAAGQNTFNGINGGQGGTGYTSTISGSSYTYSVGGGGGWAGGSPPIPATPTTYGAGGYGGASQLAANSASYGTAGVSGAVVLSYQIATYQATFNGSVVNANVLYGNAITANTITTISGIFWSNGVAYSTGSNSTYSNTNVAAYLTTATISTTGNITAANLTTAGNVTAAYVKGSAALLTSLTGAAAGVYGSDTIIPSIQVDTTGRIISITSNVSAGGGSYGNANVAAYLGSNAALAITTTANITTYANVVSANYLFPNGVNILSTVTGGTTYSNTNVAAYLTTATISTSGNITAANLTTAGNVTAAYVKGDGSLLTNLPTQAGTYSNTNVTAYLAGTVSVGNIASANGYFWSNGTAYSTGGGSSGVTQIVAGTNLNISPSGGTGTVTINANTQPGTYTNSNVTNLLSGGTYTGDVIATTGVVNASAMTATGALTAGSYLQANNGLYSIDTFSGTYSDGIVVDYATGSGRISVGTADNLTFYTGGVAATPTLQLASNGAAIAGNLITTNGVFWSNGVAYSTGSGGATTFSGDLAGNTLIDSVNYRVLVNASPFSSPSTSAPLWTNIQNNNPVYVSGVLQPAAQVTGGTTTAPYFNAAVQQTNANIALQSSYQTTTNRFTSGKIDYTQVWPVTANSMTSSDRWRGVSTLSEVMLNNATWGTSISQLSAAASAGFNTLNVVGSGTMGPVAGLQNLTYVTPNGTAAGSGLVANISHVTGINGSVQFLTTYGTNQTANVTYARGFIAVVTTGSSNHVITNAVGYHTPSGWVTAPGGNGAGITNRYSLLNEDSNSLIQTNANIQFASGTGKSLVFGDGSSMNTAYSNVNVASYLSGTVSVGNIASTNGYFWSNGNAYVGNNLQGYTLFDSVNERIVMNANNLSAISFPTGSFLNVNFFAPNALSFYGNGVVSPATGSGAATYTASANLTVATRNGTNWSPQGQYNLTQMYPDPAAASMANADRIRGVTNMLEVYPSGKNWGSVLTTPTATNASTAANLTPIVSMNGFLSTVGTGYMVHTLGVVGANQNNPVNGSANVFMQTGVYATVGWNSATAVAAGRLASNIAYTRLFGGVINGGAQQANLTITNAVGLHITNAWAPGGVGGIDTITNRYAVLNEDAKTIIQTNGNISITSTATTGLNSTGVFTVTAINAITGVAGQFASVSNGTGKNNGQMAYWDATNARWSWFDTNLAVS